MELKVKKNSIDAQLPYKKYDTDAGFDLTSIEMVNILPNTVAKIKTGICVELPYGYAGLIWDRSGLGSNGIHRFAGVIDFGYLGEILVCLYNSTNSPYIIQKGDRIAQLIIQKVEYVDIIEVDVLTPTNRGEGGFGSTGK